MTKISFEDNFEIYLFTDSNTTLRSSKLNEFLAFLKTYKINTPYKFSFVSREAGLIPEMTLNQNILIDFCPNSLTESKEIQFQEFLKTQPNRPLENLYQSILLPHEYPLAANAQMKKVCSLIKAFLTEGQLILLEEPEIDLDQKTLDLFISALKIHLRSHPVNIFIYSKNLPLWLPHSHKTVERKDDYNFLISPTVKNYQWNEERNIFFAPTIIPSKNLGLTFKMPKEKNRKKAAA